MLDRQPRKIISLGVLLGVCLVSCSLINQVEEHQCTSNAECLIRGGAFANSRCSQEGICVPLVVEQAGNGGQAGTGGSSGGQNQGGACTKNGDCSDLGGHPLCRGGVCIQAGDGECTVVEGETFDPEPSDIIGVMVPLTGSQAAVGKAYSQAIRTAYADYKSQLPLGVAPPVLVVCDEVNDPKGVATRLIDTLEVKFILGPFWDEAIDQTLPLVLNSKRESKPLIMLPIADGAKLEEADTGQQLWMCKPNRRLVENYWNNAIGEVEKYLLKKNPTQFSPIKMGVVISQDESSKTLALRVLDKMVFNGKSQQDNESEGNYTVSQLTDPRRKGVTVNYADEASKLLPVGGIQPNLIVIISPGDGVQDMVVALENGWPSGVQRPHYLIVGGGDNIERTVVDGRLTGPKPLGRMLSLDVVRSAVSDQLYNSLRLSYNQIFSSSLLQPEAEYGYDGMWLIEYGLYSSTAKQQNPLSSVTPEVFASQGIGLFNPPGQSVQVGPNGENGEKRVFQILSLGGNPDIIGASSELDFVRNSQPDVVQKSPTARGRLRCLNQNKLMVSGLEFDPETGAVSGANNCP